MSYDMIPINTVSEKENKKVAWSSQNVLPLLPMLSIHGLTARAFNKKNTILLF